MKSADNKEQNYQFKTNVNMKTKTSILVLKKAFFILLVSGSVISCNQKLEIEKVDTPTKWVIVKAEQENRKLSTYKLKSINKSNLNISESTWICDTIGAYVIGDTVCFKHYR